MKGLRSFGQAFFAGEDAVRPFLARPRNMEELAARMAGGGHGCDPALRDELLRQNPGGAELIATLCGPGGRAVVTGQQVGLFLGPLYTFHKALTTVLLAKGLRAQGVRAVPVFWLQVEDHDLGEVEDVAVRRLDGTYARLAPTREAGRTSLAHHHVDKQTEAVLRQLSEALEGLPRAAEVCALMEEAYEPGTSYAAAFTRALQSLFHEDEMLVFNPRTTVAAALALPLHWRATAQSESIGMRLAERSGELARAGFQSQVSIRTDHTLSFFHSEGIEGPRYRLRKSKDGFERLGLSGTMTMADIERQSSAEPLLFSSSALLRPVIQDRFFPKGAYVGGPGELSYYAQLRPIYDALEVEPGTAVPRMRARYVSSRTRSSLARWKVSGPLREPASWTQTMQSVVSANAEVDALREEALSHLSVLEANWPDAAAKAKRSIEGALHAFTGRVSREVLGESELQRDYQSVLHELEPNGTPQERAVVVADVLARFSPATMRAELERLYKPLHDTVLEPNLETDLEPEGRLISAERQS